MVKLVLATGMRQQEVRNLRWENVGQFKKNTIHIAKAKVTRRGEKPRKRDTIISLECRRVLSEIREVLGLSNHGFIFPDPAGLTCSAVQNYYQKAIVLAVEECNLSEKLTFHDLRHVAITKMANIFKKDPLKLAKSAGHSDIRMFFDVYYNPDMADAAADYQQAELQRMRELEGIKDIDAEIAETQKRMSDLLTLKTKLMN
jgi:integrase